eukprot:CAMPEP_0197493314 /NCGR_PEP_ID=MMETSP1311-20131121/21219_1 /TAXON_ID=464262 /ORGANISM="Genus nov. species nov., Strain RCC856" /LENGTH=126 /DNA_ID=CAMNT_0043038543 /DNA_START=1 /DNA_END=382 /DNA_ORIENTATION=-
MIMCASVALANARVPLYDLVASAMVSQRSALAANADTDGADDNAEGDSGAGAWLLDPTAKELDGARASVAVAYMAARNQVTLVDASGDWDTPQALKECMDTCVDGCKKMRPILGARCSLQASDTPA